MTPASPLVVAVDDESDDIFFLQRTLTKTEVPHRFQPYSNGEAAMTALGAMLGPEPHEGAPVIVFLDIKMVGMSGFDVLRWIRAQRALDGLPVFMYSSSDHPTDVSLARELGAQGYLKKYPSVSAMTTVLEEAIAFSTRMPPRNTFLQWSYRFVDSTPSRAVAAG